MWLCKNIKWVFRSHEWNWSHYCIQRTPTHTCSHRANYSSARAMGTFMLPFPYISGKHSSMCSLQWWLACAISSHHQTPRCLVRIHPRCLECWGLNAPQCFSVTPTELTYTCVVSLLRQLGKNLSYWSLSPPRHPNSTMLQAQKKG